MPQFSFKTNHAYCLQPPSFSYSYLAIGTSLAISARLFSKIATKLFSGK
jgi:hypothetical protein